MPAGGLEAIQHRLGYRFRQEPLLVEALTHASYLNEARGAGERDNERLEFLGDAVLNLVVSDYLIAAFPDAAEGELSKLRSRLVSEKTLSGVARRIGLGEALRLGRGERATQGHEKASILADALEAVLGAIYLDRGLDAARDLIVRVFRPRMIAYVRGEGERDYKTILQEMASSEMHALPDYRITERGPDHEKEFTATVHLAGQEWGSGIGHSKKEAEQQAAHEAYLRLTERAVPERDDTKVRVDQDPIPDRPVPERAKGA